ncbi:MAG: murein biosynthesis integral membrane protein MurJ [Thermodesulfobacteriota bacterium]
MNEHAKRIAKDVSIVSGATLASRILGFFRDVILASVLGAGIYADAFYVAFRLPNMLRRLFAEGSMTMAFVPVFSRLRETEGDAAAFAMARSAMVWLLAILSVLTVVAIFFAEPLTRLIAPGFAAKPELFALTVDMVRIVFPYIIQISAVALCMGVLNSMGHFLAPALATSELNTAIILGAAVAWLFGLDPAYTLAWSVLVGGFGQWSMQQPWLRKFGMRWRGPFRLKDPSVIKMAKLMLPTAFGAAVYQINILLGTFLASFLPVGSVSSLYYADRLVQFPLGVFGVAIGTVALPSLAKLVAADRMEEFTGTLRASMRLTLFISLPSTAGLIALAYPMVTVLFGRGAFSPEAAQATSSALIAYSVGLPAFACVRPLFSAFYALSDTKTPAWTAAACLAAYAATGYALMGPMGHVGLALATSVSSWLNVIILGIVLRRKLGPWMPLDKTLVVGSALSLGIGLAAFALSGYPVASLIAIAPLAAGYMAVSALLGVEEARMLAGFAARLVSRRFRTKSS